LRKLLLDKQFYRGGEAFLGTGTSLKWQSLADHLPGNDDNVTLKRHGFLPVRN